MRTHSYRRTAAGMTAALVVGLGIAVGAAAPAQAHVLDVGCTGTMSTTLSPGLLLTPQEITTENTFIYSTCESTSDPSLTFGTNTSTVVAVFSCLDPMGSGTGTKKIEWNNGQSSTFQFNFTFSTIAGQFVTVQTGVITEGQFAGDSALEIIVGPAINLADCVFPPGITNRTSLTALKISGT